MLEFIPRKQIVAHLESGWRLLPNHRYIPHDYAILMQKVESPEPLTSEQIQAIFADFSPPKHDKRRCKRGHYLSGDNIYMRGNAVCCRTCKRLNQAAYMKRQRAMECA